MFFLLHCIRLPPSPLQTLLLINASHLKIKISQRERKKRILESHHCLCIHAQGQGASAPRISGLHKDEDSVTQRGPSFLQTITSKTGLSLLQCFGLDHTKIKWVGLCQRVKPSSYATWKLLYYRPLITCYIYIIIDQGNTESTLLYLTQKEFEHGKWFVIAGGWWILRPWTHSISQFTPIPSSILYPLILVDIHAHHVMLSSTTLLPISFAYHIIL